MSEDKVRAYIEQHGDAFIAELQALGRQPSIGVEDVGMEECAAMVREIMERRGIATRLLSTGGHPAVYGEIQGQGDRSLLFYGHYDVVPTGPLEEWEAPPFGAEIRGDRMIGRGVSDHKGSFLSRVQAIEALQQEGELPVTIKFLLEGDEEQGSPYLLDLVVEQKELLQADAALYAGWMKDEEDRPMMNAGQRGTVRLTLTCQTANQNLHGRNAALLPNPVWPLVRALNTLQDENGEILIDGFYDDAEEPSPEDLEALRRTPFSGEVMRKRLGVKAFLGGVDGLDAVRRMAFAPACRVGEIGLGATGAQLLGKSSARVVFALVPRQVPEDIVAKLERHLAAHGYGDIQVEGHLPYGRPARIPLTERIVQVGIEAARQTYGQEPVVIPVSPGSGPRWILVDALGVPTIADPGIGYAGSNDHAVNENIRLADYLQGIAYMTELIRRF